MTRRTIHGQIGRALGKKLEAPWVNIDGKRVQIEIRTRRNSDHDTNYHFNAVYCHGKEDYEWARADSASEAQQALIKLLKDSLGVEYDRKLYIHVSHGGNENHGWHNIYIQYGHKLGISIGIVDVGRCGDETLYRRVNARYLGDPDEPETDEEWEFSPERSTSPSGPTPGHDEHFGTVYGDGLIPFTMENFRKMRQILEQLERLGETVKDMITGKDPEAIVSRLHDLALPAPTKETK